MAEVTVEISLEDAIYSESYEDVIEVVADFAYEDPVKFIESLIEEIYSSDYSNRFRDELLELRTFLKEYINRRYGEKK